MNSFKLSVLAPGNPFFKGDCVSLVMPTTDGKYGVMAHHCNAIVTVIPGVIEYVLLNGEKKKARVSNGILTSCNNEVLVLVDSVTDMY